MSPSHVSWQPVAPRHQMADLGVGVQIHIQQDYPKGPIAVSVVAAGSVWISLTVPASHGLDAARDAACAAADQVISTLQDALDTLMGVR